METKSKLPKQLKKCNKCLPTPVEDIEDDTQSDTEPDDAEPIPVDTLDMAPLKRGKRIDGKPIVHILTNGSPPLSLQKLSL